MLYIYPRLQSVVWNMELAGNSLWINSWIVLSLSIKKIEAPEADGVLIFDELCVVSRLMWNSHRESLV